MRRDIIVLVVFAAAVGLCFGCASTKNKQGEGSSPTMPRTIGVHDGIHRARYHSDIGCRACHHLIRDGVPVSCTTCHADESKTREGFTPIDEAYKLLCKKCHQLEVFARTSAGSRGDCLDCHSKAMFCGQFCFEE